jgi:hypothetical protein
MKTNRGSVFVIGLALLAFLTAAAASSLSVSRERPGRERLPRRAGGIFNHLSIRGSGSLNEKKIETRQII